MKGEWKKAYSAEALARRYAALATPEYRAKAAARSRAWVLANKGRATATRKRYYEANKAHLTAASKARYENGGRERDRQQRARRRATDPVYREKVRSQKRQWRGLPAPTRARPVECESCGRKPLRVALCLDHCHVTHKFRGWLCDQCNRAAGLLGDTLEGAKNLVRYLERNA